MPTLEHVANALRQYRERYTYLDAFGDDIEEIRSQTVAGMQVENGGNPVYVVPVGIEQLRMQTFPQQGVVRFALAQGQPHAATAAAIGGALGTVIAAAAKAKGNGLLGGLILGMLVGGALATPVERVLAMQFDASSGRWRLYDGPLLRWAKGAINPPAG